MVSGAGTALKVGLVDLTGSMDDEHFLRQIWSGHGSVKFFLVHFISDLIKSFCLLAGLWLFWESISFLRFRHYPDDYLRLLEKLHFAATFCILTVTSIAFLVSQVASWFAGKKTKTTV